MPEKRLRTLGSAEWLLKEIKDNLNATAQISYIMDGRFPKLQIKGDGFCLDMDGTVARYVPVHELYNMILDMLDIT